MFDRRITLFCGHYGSGKTEIAVNTALALKAQNPHVALVDLDIINPYFRAAEQRAVLENAGVRVLCPTFALTSVDIPGLPAQIQSVFDQKHERVVFDVGGDDTGSVALGRYKPYFEQDDYEMMFVLNALRPFSSTIDEICDLYARITGRARMLATAIISNTNFGAQTSIEDVLRGHELTVQAAKALNLPIRAITGEAATLRQLPPALQEMALPIEIRMRPEWL